MGSNSTQCTNCQRWIHRRGSAVKGSLCKATVCLFPTDNEVKSSVDIDDGSSEEIVDEFCYLGDLLSVDGDADAAVTTSICSGWFKFRSLASFLAAKFVSLLLRGKVSVACLRGCMLHGRET